MAKILVFYDSETGNTEKMAFAVAEGAKQINGVDVVVKKLTTQALKDLVNADGIMMGSPTYFGQMSHRLKALIDESVKIHEKLEGKVGAAFTSSGGTATGAETPLLSMLQTMLVHGVIVQGRADDKHYGATTVENPPWNEYAYVYALDKSTVGISGRECQNGEKSRFLEKIPIQKAENKILLTIPEKFWRFYNMERKHSVVSINGNNILITAAGKYCLRKRISSLNICKI